MASRRLRLQTRTIVAVVAVIVVAGAGATAAFAATGSSSHAYRTATATQGAVARALQSTGTIEPVSEATVAFPVAGTVATVGVAVGDRVVAGQNLAAIDATSYEQDLIAKQAKLAAANLTLSKAVDSASSTAPTTPARNGGAGSAPDAAGAQRQLLTAQQNVDTALATVQTSLQTASKACATAVPSSGPSEPGTPHTGSRRPTGSRTSSSAVVSASTTSTTVAVTAKPATVGIGSAACIAAQQQLFADQQGLAAAQQSLAQAEQAFERALSAASSSASSASSSSSLGSGGRNSGGASSASSSSTSAAQLVADQAAVDAAATAVLAAQESVQQATITTPIAGTVAAVSVKPGDTVTAASTTDTIVVVGGDGFEVSTTVGVNDIGEVKVGDAATVAPDGTSTTIAGRVVWIGAANGTSSSTTYPVVIGLRGAAEGLRNGAMAATSIELAHSKKSAVTVPTSAVHTRNTLHTVTLLDGGKVSTVGVQVGVVGAEKTEITSGLQVGQVVVLADMHAAVPASNNASRIVNAVTGGGGGGTFSGGSFGGGNFVRGG
jgi:HlyD family secretion protein